MLMHVTKMIDLDTGKVESNNLLLEIGEVYFDDLSDDCNDRSSVSEDSGITIRDEGGDSLTEGGGEEIIPDEEAEDNTLDLEDDTSSSSSSSHSCGKGEDTSSEDEGEVIVSEEEGEEIVSEEEGEEIVSEEEAEDTILDEGEDTDSNEELDECAHFREDGTENNAYFDLAEELEWNVPVILSDYYFA